MAVAGFAVGIGMAITFCPSPRSNLARFNISQNRLGFRNQNIKNIFVYLFTYGRQSIRRTWIIHEKVESLAFGTRSLPRLDQLGGNLFSASITGGKLLGSLHQSIFVPGVGIDTNSSIYPATHEDKNE